MAKVKDLHCVKCQKHYAEGEAQYVCPSCGLEGILNVNYDYPTINLNRAKLQADKNYSISRYLDILPFENKASVDELSLGFTPLYDVPRVRRALKLNNLYIKDDSRNPTLSFKDRASAIAIARAKEAGAEIIAAASTGNAASSIAGFSASAGIKNIIFVPKTIPKAKLTQLLVFGSIVFLVDGSYDDAFELCYEVASEYGWYIRSCAINPYLVEGKKTAAFEIIEQLNFEVPDYVVLPVGDGCIISGVSKGFAEFKELGIIDRLPKMIGVQSNVSNPITRAFRDDKNSFDFIAPTTRADSISVGIPRNGLKALQNVRNSNGFMMDVSDDQIMESIVFMAKYGGIFSEPAGAAGFAGIQKLNDEGFFKPDDKIVTIVTGSGLKDLTATADKLPNAYTVKKDKRAVIEILDSLK